MHFPGTGAWTALWAGTQSIPWEHWAPYSSIQATYQEWCRCSQSDRETNEEAHQAAGIWPWSIWSWEGVNAIYVFSRYSPQCSLFLSMFWSSNASNVFSWCTSPLRRPSSTGGQRSPLMAVNGRRGTERCGTRKRSWHGTMLVLRCAFHPNVCDAIIKLSCPQALASKSSSVSLRLFWILLYSPWNILPYRVPWTASGQVRPSVWRRFPSQVMIAWRRWTRSWPLQVGL